MTPPCRVPRCHVQDEVACRRVVHRRQLRRGVVLAAAVRQELRQVEQRGAVCKGPHHISLGFRVLGFGFWVEGRNEAPRVPVPVPPTYPLHTPCAPPIYPLYAPIAGQGATLPSRKSSPSTQPSEKTSAACDHGLTLD